jgi:hypothetical protein
VALHVGSSGAGRTPIPLGTWLESWVEKLTWRRRWRSGVRASLPLAAGERVLLVVPDIEGRPVAATDQALYLGQRPGPGGATDDWVHIGWEQADGVEWDDEVDEMVLRVSPAARLPDARLSLPGGAALSAIARERLAWSTLARSRVALDGYGDAVVVVRRQPGSERVLWEVVAQPGTDVDHPGFSRAADRAIRRLRSRLGV